MAEEVEISVELAAEYHDAMPQVEFLIDDELVADTVIMEKFKDNSSTTFTWSGKLTEETHTIKIRLKNKMRSQTKVNEQGEILADQLLRIVRIKIDQIDLGMLIYFLSNFYPDKNIRPDLPDVIPNLITIGYNGEYRLEFTVPTYLWLLEHF